MRVKSRNPAAEYSNDFAVGDLRQMISHTDHRIGNQVRRVADHGHHKIMVRSIHHIDLRAHRLQQPTQPRKCRRLGVRSGGQQPPAVPEQRRKARTRPGMFGARHRMTGNELHILRDMRCHGGNDRLFDRAHISDRRSPVSDTARFRRQSPPSPPPEPPAPPDRRPAPPRRPWRRPDRRYRFPAPLSRVSSLRAWPTISPASPYRRIACAMDEAISPSPISATRL